MVDSLTKYALDKVNPDELLGALDDRFGLYSKQRLKRVACKHRFGFYKNFIKLMAPALITWMLVQGVAAAYGNHTSRWVGMLAIGLASVVFAIAWYLVVDSRC
jgi:hypothetical protein